MCRSLSGAVIPPAVDAAGPITLASIVPLPFGSGYKAAAGESDSEEGASIVPLPFGSGYLDACHPGRHRAGCFNCAAPFRERLWHQRGRHRPGHWRSFNCAAPFRERLYTAGNPVRLTVVRLQLCRSLSGAVMLLSAVNNVYATMLQLCRSLSGAVMTTIGRATSDCTQLQLCRSLSGAVISAGVHASATGVASFNCAAPFRERLCRSHAWPAVLD